MGHVLLALWVVAAPVVAPELEKMLQEAARLDEAGDREAASAAYHQALEHAPPGSPERGRALVGLSRIETSLGQYSPAAAHAQEAADIYSALGDPRPYATALNRVGVAALHAGKYVEAAAAFESAIKLSSASGDREGHAEQLGNLANVFFFVGRYSDAARSYDEVLAQTAASPGEGWVPRRRRLVLANKANLFWRLGRDQQALALYRELGASRDLLPDEEAQLLVNQGALYRRLGDPVKALGSYDKALQLFARRRNVDGELNVMKNRGIVLALDLGRLDDAERSFSRVLEVAAQAGNRRQMLHARLYRGETLLRAGHIERAAADFATGLALANELRTPEEEWKALYGLGRSERRPDEAREYLARAVSVIEQIREDIRVPSLRSDFFNDKREVYDALIAARLESASPADVFDLIERGRSRAWRERLGLSGPIDLASVQRAMPAGVLLLDYWSSSRGSAVVAATRGRATVRPVDVDDGQVQALIDGLASGPATEWRDHARTIAAHVLPPADWFEGIEHIIVVTDGALALVPFELLTSGDGLLIQHMAVSYTPTAATLLRPAAPTPAWSPPWRLQLRAFGDPVFASASLDDAAPLRRRLASSAREVRQVASELGGAAALYLGSENRKSRLYDAAQHAPILHLATHAMADANAMEQSRIVFSPQGSEAGADYLFLREAYELQLAGVDLAVLSACDTERGRLLRGEGVQSFSRAFLAAGARSTVTTLWRVADGPTADFMQVFYHHLQRGVSRDEALRRAKLRFIESDSTLAHPHFWAAFVLTGDALRPVPRALTWDAVAFAAVVVVLAAFGGARLVLRRRTRIEPARVA